MSKLYQYNGKEWIEIGKDGVSPDPVEVAKIALDSIKSEIPTIDAIVEKIPVIGEKVRDSLELLSDDDRLSAEAIKGLEKYTGKKYDNEIATLQNRTQLLNQIASGAIRRIDLLEADDTADLSRFLKLDQSTPQTITGTTGPLINSGYDWSAGNVTYVPLTGNIATYVAAASAGDTLVLAAGNYAITAQINLTQAINIVGQGVGQTTITHTATEATDFTFYATASNVRIAHLSIVMNHSVGTTRSGAIRFDGTAGTIITGGMVTNVNITNTTTTAQVEGITFTDASGTVRDCNVTATTSGTNKAANAVYFLTNATAEAATTSYVYNTHATSTGTGTSVSSVAFYTFDNGSGFDCNVYLYNCNGIGTGTSAMEAGIYANNGNAKMYAYNCIFNGDDYDASQANSAVVQLSNCTLVNNTTNGTITYDGAIAGEGLTLLSGGDIRPSADSTTAINIAQADGTDFVTFDTTNKRVGVGVTPLAPFHSVGTGFPTAIFELNNAGSATTTSAFNLYRNQTSPVANDGTGFVFSFNNSSAVKTNFARLTAIATAVTAGAETAAMTFDLGTSLAEKMRITSTGNVGIGTTAPTTTLDVNGNVRIGTGSGVGIDRSLQLYSKSNWGYTFSTSTDNFTFTDSTPTTLMQVTYGNGTTTKNLALMGGVFNILGASGGNVGIGTTAPAQLLHVYGATNPSIELQSATGIGYLTQITTDGAFSNISLINDTVLRANTLNLILTARNATGDIKFATGAADSAKMVILNGGNVGIGTTAPAVKLDVLSTVGTALRATVTTVADSYAIQANGTDAGTNNILPLLNLKRTSSGTTAAGFGTGINFTLEDLAGNEDRLAAQILVQWDGGTGNYPGALSFWTRAAGGGSITERMRIDSTGNVGIGTTAPTAVLHLKAGTATASTAPLKFTSGVSLTNAEAGAMEYTTDDLFFTISTGTARKRLLMADAVGGLTSGKIPVATTNGRLADVTAQTELTDEDATATDGTDATQDQLINNMRTRINELETKLTALGLISDSD